MKLPALLDKAIDAQIIDCFYSTRQCFLRRARRAYKRNLAEPGDCQGDDALLAGLALAEAYVGRSAGWIPTVQTLGVKIANLIES